jgi:gluconolactonase
MFMLKIKVAGIILLCMQNIWVASILAQPPVEKLLTGYRFTEGPAVNDPGVLYFSDVPERKVYRYSSGSEAELFINDSGGINGLFFAQDGSLFGCAGKEIRAVLQIKPSGEKEILVDQYQGKKLNSPNDLWVDKHGGIYFTDPRYGNRDNMEQDGEHVYYVSPDRQELVRVTEDLVRPNGIVGTADGERLYITDQGAGKTYVYHIVKPGVLKRKKLFTDYGIDGLSVGKNNEVFITTSKAVRQYNQEGILIRNIDFTDDPTNVCYHQGTLFVTTQGGEVFKVEVD